MRSKPLFLALVLILASLAGCAATPRQQFAQVQDAYIVVVETLLQARADGLIKDNDWDRVVEKVVEGDKLLDELDILTSTGGPEDPTLSAKLRQIITALRAFLPQKE